MIRCFFTIAFIITGCLASGQSKDAEVWSGIGIRKNFSAGHSIMFKQEVRLNRNVSNLDSWFGDIGYRYNLSPDFRISINYRVSRNDDFENTYGWANRVYADFNYNKRVKVVSFGYRMRLQRQYSNINTTETGHLPKDVLRNRFRVAWSPDRPYAVYFTVEPFTELLEQAQHTLEKVRFTIGVDNTLNKRNKIDVFYRIQRETYSDDPLTVFIGGIRYAYIF